MSAFQDQLIDLDAASPALATLDPAAPPRRGSAAEAYPLSIALADYDRTRPLIDGRVTLDGIAPTITTAWIGDFCERPVYEEYDVAEMSLSWYVAARCRGEPVVALPIFPLRMPVLGYMFVRGDSDIASPAALAGKRIGVPGYRYTVNLWIRGIVKDVWGVAPEAMRWVTCARNEGAGFVHPAGLDVTVAEGRTAEDLLLAGEVDAMFSPSIPDSFLAGDTRLRRLFPDARATMGDYVRTSGIYPITHTIVMAEALWRAEPWLAERLVAGFRAAQDLFDAYVLEPKRSSFPEAVFMLEEQRRSYGATPWVHGLEPNRHVLETFVRYAHEQGYIDRRPALEDLFAANTLTL